MKVKMIKTQKGAEDGITVKTYEAGIEYEMVEKLAKIFVNVLNVAEFVKEEVKAMPEAPENKMAKIFDNKGKDRK
jgi:hypothetical protein